MTFANFDFDDKTPKILKEALLSMNSNRKKGSNFFKATGLDVETYLKSEGWTPAALDAFELGLYTALETTRQSVAKILKDNLRFP
jgi:hypothetical protein